MRAVLAALFFVSPFAMATPSRADPPAEGVPAPARAEGLFHDGERLFDAHEFEAACNAFDRSERVDPQLGTLLNLAFCHDTIGWSATAWREYLAGAAWAAQRGQHERQAWALGRAADLGARLSVITFLFSAGPRPSAIAVDDTPVPESLWGAPVPLDPGSHALKITAPGSVASVVTVTVAPGPSSAPVRIPTLTPAAPPEPAPDPRPGRAIAGALAIGVGVAAVGAGTYFGVTTLVKKSDAAGHCDGSACDATGVALQDDAHTSATASTLSFGIALVALSAGTWLALTSRGAEPRSATPAHVRTLAWTGNGVRLEAAW